ncbi:hypothetical protein [Carboxylicivirga linearis]|uniref:Oligosaccharide repeat unit polymerase n=1 Tax=Carboxylicivirga linearis TaxID=1628157 RepID=A0ABS5JUG1_9BACT|nr:hypothetical protein [Carboxylicivirga linearis]MBS2098535.1 hypothetical protein [Carboxylicivirga linearis]
MERSIPDRLMQPFHSLNKPSLLLNGILSVGVILTLFGLTTGYGVKLAVSFALLYTIVRLFYAQGFTVVIFLALLYQWFQVSIKVFYGFFNNLPFESLTVYPQHFDSAFYTGAIGLFALSLGIYQSLKKICFSIDSFNNEIENINVIRCIVFYLSFGLFLNLLHALRHVLPGAYQAISLLTNFKWSLFFILFVIVHKKKQLIGVFWGIVAYEFIGSFFSFFASFKSIVFFVLIAYLSISSFNYKKLVIAISAGFGVYMLAIFWTAVKGDYRDFLNQGTRTQRVLVQKDEALNFLSEKIFQFNIPDDNRVQKDFIDRMSYIDFISACMNYVPSELPHENGVILKKSINHILIPRIINPNKPIIDDSNHLNKYTGLNFANSKQGVSFSLGYVGDFYIDFGAILMFIPIFFFGSLIGFVLRNIFNTVDNPLWGAALITGSFDVLYKFETSQIKFLGNLIWYWIVFYFLAKYIIPRIRVFINSN